MASSKVVVFDDLRGGRNKIVPPWMLRRTQCVDAINVEYWQSQLGRKRAGSTALSVTFSAGGPFVGPITSLQKHVPGTDPTLAELWACDGGSATPVFGRLAGAATWTAPTLKDNVTNGFAIVGKSINSKFALVYGSAVNRMHGWDGSTVRRFGMAATAAPTAADTGGGAYAAVLRYYRERSTTQVAGITTRRSEPSPSVSFTPSGAGAAARITQATVVNEGETHWEVEVSIDNVTFYRIATVVIGTTTYDDSAATTSYNTNPLSAATGFYTLQKSYLYIAVDQNRLLGFGSRTATDKQSRIELSAVIGSSDVSDEERVDTTINYFVDLDEANSGGPMGLAGPVNGSFFAFKYRQIAMLTPTGQTAQPYAVKFISKEIGTINNSSIVVAEDAAGSACLYWMSHRGPYRYGPANGLEYIGEGIEDCILGPTSTIQTSFLVAFSVYYSERAQVWFWVAVSGVLSALFIYHIRTNGWTRYTGTATNNCAAAVMFANTVGVTMSLDEKPYTAGFPKFVGHPALISKWNTGTTDILSDETTETFQANVLPPVIEAGGPDYFGEMRDPILMADAASGVSINCAVAVDFGAQGGSLGAGDLTPVGAEATVMTRIENTAIRGGRFYALSLGDNAARTATWNLQRVIVPLGPPLERNA